MTDEPESETPPPPPWEGRPYVVRVEGGLYAFDDRDEARRIFKELLLVGLTWRRLEFHSFSRDPEQIAKLEERLRERVYAPENPGSNGTPVDDGLFVCGKPHVDGKDKVFTSFRALRGHEGRVHAQDKEPVLGPPPTQDEVQRLTQALRDDERDADGDYVCNRPHPDGRKRFFVTLQPLRHHLLEEHPNSPSEDEDPPERGPGAPRVSKILCSCGRWIEAGRWDQHVKMSKGEHVRSNP